MIRTNLTSNNTHINILIPNDYVGKQLEVLVYAKEEVSESVPEALTKRRKPSEFIGSISKDKAVRMLHEIQKSRNEWEQDI